MSYLLAKFEAGVLGAWLKVRIKGIARRARERWAGKSAPEAPSTLQSKIDALKAKYAKGG